MTPTRTFHPIWAVALTISLGLACSIHNAKGAEPDMAGMDPGMDHSKMDHSSHIHGMPGVLGPTDAAREASGTSWQPDATPHGGLHFQSGEWMFMAHAMFNGVYDWQEGPLGGHKTFLSGMIMAAAQRKLDDRDTLNFRAMISPDPFMGKRGYPLLLASGETANGVTPLVNRQHPHDLIMELSTSFSHRLASDSSVFVYAGWPGEPAFGPPAFMHRLSAMDSPEAPITHHWLDSTHIVAGVVTLGLVHGPWKLDVSSFTGREPNRYRYDIDHPRFDSTSARMTWNPDPHLSLQISWADVHSPEQLTPQENQTRWSASAIYTVPVGTGGYWSTTLAWGRKDISQGPRLDAGTIESAYKPNAAWTFFSRGEIIRSNELDPLGGHGQQAPQTAGKVTLGAIRDFPVARHVKFGIGGLYTFNRLPNALQAEYGGNPNGAMGFVRIKVD